MIWSVTISAKAVAQTIWSVTYVAQTVLTAISAAELGM
jgi:hypothetical protein